MRLGSNRQRTAGVVASVSLVLACTVGLLIAQTRTGQTANQPNAPRDATAEAQTPRQVPTTRPEQQKSDHDRMDFDSRKAMPASPVFKTQDCGLYRRTAKHILPRRRRDRVKAEGT